MPEPDTSERVRRLFALDPPPTIPPTAADLRQQAVSLHRLVEMALQRDRATVPVPLPMARSLVRQLALAARLLPNP